MRSPTLRRAAIAAALVFADVLWLVSWPGDFDVRGDPIRAFWLACGWILATLATVLVPAAFGARMLARQHVRAGGADPLEGVRRRVAAGRSIFRGAYVGVALFVVISMVLVLVEALRRHQLQELPALVPVLRVGAVFLCGMVLPALAVVLALRAFGRGAIAPLVHPAELERRDADGYAFSAVSVTAASRAAVGLLALLTVGVVAIFTSASDAFFRTSTPTAVAIGYCVVAVLMASSFRRISRIAIGLDGVRVSGTSRPRFHAYRDLEGVDVARDGEVLLLRPGRAALRLQLHGEDASRRGPIVERLRAAIARAQAPGSVAQRLAEAATPAILAQAARGHGDYRSPAASRDALWEVLEAPSARGETRARAARALAAGADGADRARLRFAAQRCADPEARETLARIAVGELEDEESEAPAPRRAALRVEGR
jgi:hypothetical protein